MEANTVVLSLERYHELLDYEKITNTEPIFKHTILLNVTSNIKLLLKTDDEAVSNVGGILKKTILERDELTFDLFKANKLNKELVEDHEHKLEELAEMSVWEFRKWRKTI